MTSTSHNITTTAGETFTGGEATEMARLILRRWGNDMAAAASAWRRLMQNNCTDAAFEQLVRAESWPPAPELVVAALAGAAVPKIGDGATEYSYSDRHAYTIVEVVSPTCVKVQRDHLRRTGWPDQSFAPNPEAPVEVLVFKVTKRHPDGKWVRKSEGVRGNGFQLGSRSEYRDPSF